MIKQVIKYCLLLCFAINVILTQNNSNLNHTTAIDTAGLINNAVNFSPYPDFFPEEMLRLKSTNEKTGNTIIANKSSKEENKKIVVEFYRIFPEKNQPESKPENPEFNIVSSFKENIRFGGFWNKYAIINFNPSVNLKPVDFISIYANENLSCFVPISEIKEYAKLMVIHSAAILAVDNSFKLFFNQNDWVVNTVSFLFKNIVTSILKYQINNISNYKIYNQDSYYLAVSVRF